MKKELLTEDELMSEIRLSGIKELKDVQEAFMESDGRISIISKDNTKSISRQEKRII